jgi:non-specific serine/threonine protein kinase
VYGIQKLERGTTHPYRNTAERLALALELTSDDLDQFRALVVPVRLGRISQLHASDGDRLHNLPLALSSFVGREADLSDILSRLRSNRLLTLTGVGGSGKTRLGIEVARRLVGEYSDGVWLVELAPVTDPALVGHRCAAVLAVPETVDQPLEHALADRLRDARVLLVVDNCEHVLDTCAPLLDLLLRACPKLQVLATSREPLGIPGEVAWVVSPLSTPEPYQFGFVAEVERSPAVRLFVDRASAALPSFALTARNAWAVAHICRRLDGMPLALELAAARLDALAPSQLANRLDQRFELLTSGSRAALPRHQTLSATIEWSYSLLTEEQQLVFERLSVFASGWALEDAEVVCAGDRLRTADVLEAVLQLVRKSLVTRIEARDGGSRYGLLETVRQYAWDKLASRPSVLDTVRERHARYYSDLVERLDPAWQTNLLPFAGETLSAPVFDILDDAHDNLRVALKWWLDTRHVNEGLVLMRALGPLWMWRGIPVDGCRWMKAVLKLAAESEETPGFSRAVWAHALFFAGVVTHMQGDHATSLNFAAASVALWRELGDLGGLAQALNGLGFFRIALGEPDQAEPLLTEALAAARTASNVLALAAALSMNGYLARARKQYGRAATLLQESVAVAGQLERPGYRALSTNRALMYLARVESERGAHDKAISLFKSVLVGFREWGITGDVLGYCLDWTAAEVHRGGDSLRAARLLGAAEAQWTRCGASRAPLEQLSHVEGLRAVQGALGDSGFVSEWDNGWSMDLARVVACALEVL